jgi:ADP-ribose pyrophosphatase
VSIINILINRNGLLVCEDEFGKIFLKPRNNLGVVMLANDHGELVVIKQFRRPIEDYTFQLPGGGVNENEQLDTAARREFKEETGYDCGTVYYLGSLLPASWRSNEVTHVFYTEEIMNHTSQKLEGHEDIEVVRLSISDLIQGIRESRYNDSELCYAVMQAILKGLIRI